MIGGRLAGTAVRRPSPTAGPPRPGVVHAAFTSLVDMIDFFDDQFRRERILPLIRGYLANPSEEDTQMLLSCFGKFVWELSGAVPFESDSPPIQESSQSLLSFKGFLLWPV